MFLAGGANRHVEFPSFSPNRYSSTAWGDRNYHQKIFDKFMRHFEDFGFPQPLQGRDVGPIRDWRFLSSDTNSKKYEIRESDKYIGENFGRVLYWLICSAHRMQDGMAVIAYYDQHINLVRWFGARFGYRVIRAHGDLNLSGNHMQMTKKMRAIFDTWLIIMPSASALAERRASQAVWAQQNTRPQPSTIQSADGIAGGQHPHRASTMPNDTSQAAASRLSVADSTVSSESLAAQTNAGQTNATTASSGQPLGMIPGTPSTLSPPMSPAARPVVGGSGAVPSRHASVTSADHPTSAQSEAHTAAVPPRTIAMAKFEGIMILYNSKYVPLCNHFLTTQFLSMEARKQQHTAISEGIMNEIILKLDDVDIQGDEVARMHRKGLIDNVKSTLGKLDETLRLATEMETQAQHNAATAAAQSETQAQTADTPPQPGISRVYTNPPTFHSTVNPAELAAGLGFVELPATSATTTSPHRPELASAPAVAEDAAAAAPKPTAVRRKAPPPPRKPVILATALYDFEPDDPDAEELAFSEGDTLEIVDKSKQLEEDGWCKARVKGQKKTGLVPLDYIEEHPNQPALPKAKAVAKSSAPAQTQESPQPPAGVVEVHGENTQAPQQPVTALGEKPLFFGQGVNQQASPGSPVRQPSGSVSSPIASAVMQPIQPVQPIQLSSPDRTTSPRPIAPHLSQSPVQPEASITPPPPYQEHASLTAGGAAASYYSGETHENDMATTETSRGGKILGTNLPTGITNPNFNASTFMSTQVFNRPQPQKQDSAGGSQSQMSTGENPEAMRSLGGPEAPTRPQSTSMKPQGAPSKAQGAPSKAQGAPTKPHGAQARPLGPSATPGAPPGPQGRPNRVGGAARAPNQNNMMANAAAFGNAIGGVGRIVSAVTGRGGRQNQGCGCGGSGCGRCGGGSGGAGNVNVNQTLNVTNNNQVDNQSEFVVSPIDPGQTSFGGASLSATAASDAAPRESDVSVLSDAGTTVVSTSGSGATTVFTPEAAVTSPLAGLAPSNTGGDSYFAITEGTASPLAGLAPTPGAGDTTSLAMTSNDESMSPLAGLAVTESMSTTNLGGGVTETTTTAVAVDPTDGDVMVATETDVSGVPVDASTLVVEESSGGSSWLGSLTNAVSYDGGDYGDGDDGGWFS